MPDEVVACPDCQRLILGYGAPDRSCERHWLEDHPGGQRIKLRLHDVDPDLLERIFGGSTPSVEDPGGGR